MLRLLHRVSGWTTILALTLTILLLLAGSNAAPGSATRDAIGGVVAITGPAAIIALLVWTALSALNLIFSGGGDHGEARAGILWGPSTYRGDNNDAPLPPDHTDF